MVGQSFTGARTTPYQDTAAFCRLITFRPTRDRANHRFCSQCEPPRAAMDAKSTKESHADMTIGGFCMITNT